MTLDPGRVQSLFLRPWNKKPSPVARSFLGPRRQGRRGGVRRRVEALLIAHDKPTAPRSAVHRPRRAGSRRRVCSQAIRPTKSNLPLNDPEQPCHEATA